jgi:SAM-dependent methyltransferase
VSERRWLLLEVAALAASVFFFGWLVKLAASRYLAPHELRALHAAWLMIGTSHGLFRSPWWYGLLSWLLGHWHVSTDVNDALSGIFAARYLSLVWVSLSALLTWNLARRVKNRAVAAIAVLLMIGSPLYVSWACEIGGDALSGFLLLLALTVLTRAAETDSGGWMVAGAALYGASALCDERALCAAPGLVLGLLLPAPQAAGGKERRVGALVLGVALPWAVTSLSFASHGAGSAFWKSELFSMAPPSDGTLSPLLEWGPWLIVLGVAGLIRELWQWCRAATPPTGALLLTTTTSLLFAASDAAVMTLVTPLLAMLAASLLYDALGARSWSKAGWSSRLERTAFIVGVPLALYAITWFAPPHYVEHSLGLAVALLGLGVVLCTAGARELGLVALLGWACVGPWYFLGGELKNEFQLRPLAWIMGQTAPDGLVLDQETLLAPFRPHFDEAYGQSMSDAILLPDKLPPAVSIQSLSQFPDVAVLAAPPADAPDEYFDTLRHQFVASAMASLFPDVFAASPPADAAGWALFEQARSSVVYTRKAQGAAANFSYFYSPTLALRVHITADLWPSWSERLVAPWMSQHASLFAGKNVLDIGTGSGVVSLYAWKLGARHIVATDLDPQALALATENFKAAGASASIVTRRVPLSDISAYSVIGASEKFDVIICDAMSVLDLDAPGNNVYVDRGDLGISILQGMRAHLNPGGKTVLFVPSAFYQLLLVKVAQKMGLHVDYVPVPQSCNREKVLLCNEYARRYLRSQGLSADYVKFGPADFPADTVQPDGEIVISP